MRGLPWLLGAGALIGAGGFLMTQGDAGADTHKQRDRLSFPTHARPAEEMRSNERRTLLPSVALAPKDDSAQRAHDPLLVALAPDAEVALVFEAGTILHAPVGQAMLGCLGEGERERMDRLVKGQGKSWLDIAERVAVSRAQGEAEMAIVQGKLGDLDWSRVFEGGTSRSYGAGTTIYAVPGGEHHVPWHAAVWKNSLLLQSRDPAPLERAIDRLDAGGSSAPLAFDEREAYGEVYGVVGREEIAKLAPEELRDRTHEAARRAVIHVDATDEVLLVADVEGSDPKQVEDLGKSIGAALAVGRLKAKSEGEDDLVRLMDLSRVRPYGNGALRAEVAIPTELMTKHMRGCRK